MCVWAVNCRIVLSPSGCVGFIVFCIRSARISVSSPLPLSSRIVSSSSLCRLKRQRVFATIQCVFVLPSSCLASSILFDAQRRLVVSSTSLPLLNIYWQIRNVVLILCAQFTLLLRLRLLLHFHFAIAFVVSCVWWREMCFCVCRFGGIFNEPLSRCCRGTRVDVVVLVVFEDALCVVGHNGRMVAVVDVNDVSNQRDANDILIPN